MSVTLNVNGTDYFYPETDDVSWGPEATDWAVAVTSGMLQKAGGVFQLLGEVDFGSGYGLKSLYYKSRSADIADAGILRLARTDSLAWRNNANGANLLLGVDASDNLTFNGVPLQGAISVSDTATIDLTLAGSVLSAGIVSASINNALISASAAIALSKLAPLTASRALVSNGSGEIAVSTVTSTTLGYLDITSSLQGLLDAKVTGPASATDTAVARFDTTSGKLLKNSAVTLSDAAVVSGISQLNVDNLRLDGNTLSSTDTNGNVVLDPNGSGLVVAESALILAEQASPTTGPTVSSGYGAIYAGADGFPYFKNDNGTATQLGAGAGGINYISNYTAESNTDNWGTYKNAVASAIPDGTITGTADITWTRSSTTPLRGSGDFNLTKGGSANRQGQGVYYPITIDRADQGRVLQIEFDYEVVSGTYATSDITVWIYDVTNAVMIQPAPSSLEGIIGSGKWQGTFQASSNSTSYRLFVHVSSTSTADYVLAYDNFSFGPQVITQGTPVTDWVSFTPVLGAGAGSTSTNVGQWRRVGDSMEIQTVQIYNGSGTSGTYTVALPSGYAIDTAKMNINGVTGVAAFFDASTVQEYVCATATNGSSLTGMWRDASGGSLLTNTSIASGDYTRMNFRVPILGWSSQVQMSSQTSTRVVAMEARHSGTVATSAGTWQTIAFSGSSFDTVGGFNGTDTYTVAVPGIYEIGGFVTQSTDAAAYIDVGYRINGGSDVLLARGLGAVGKSGVASGTALVSLTAGQTIQARVLTEGTQGYNLRRLYIERLSGPSQIAANETVKASYSSSAGQSIANGATPIVDFATKTFDSTNSVTTGASWKFTAPIPGCYRISTNLRYGNGLNWAIGGYVGALVYKNGVLYRNVDTAVQVASTALATGLSTNLSTTIDLIAGDYIDIRTAHGESSARALVASAGLVWVCIERVGN